jgi:hypothetical protein
MGTRYLIGGDTPEWSECLNQFIENFPHPDAEKVITHKAHEGLVRRMDACKRHLKEIEACMQEVNNPDEQAFFQRSGQEGHSYAGKTATTAAVGVPAVGAAVFAATLPLHGPISVPVGATALSVGAAVGAAGGATLSYTASVARESLRGMWTLDAGKSDMPICLHEPLAGNEGKAVNAGWTYVHKGAGLPHAAYLVRNDTNPSILKKSQNEALVIALKERKYVWRPQVTKKGTQSWWVVKNNPPVRGTGLDEVCGSARAEFQSAVMQQHRRLSDNITVPNVYAPTILDMPASKKGDEEVRMPGF